MNICIDSLEFYIVMLLLQIGNECRINIMCQDHCILPLLFEHIDVLTLLLFIRHVENISLWCLFRLFWIRCLLCLCLFCCFSAIGLDTVFQSEIFVVKILKQHRIFYFFSEFFIFQTSKLDKRTDIIPVFFIIFSVCFEHTVQFVCNLLRNIVCNFCYKSIILQCTSGYIQRQIRTVDHTF